MLLVPMGKLLNISLPPCSHLQNGGDNNNDFVDSLSDPSLLGKHCVLLLHGY